MHRTARRTALCPLSGIPTVRVPRGGWHREDPGGPGSEGGTGTGHDPNAGGKDDADDTGKDGDGKTPKIEGEFDKERAERQMAAAREGERKAKEAKKAADERVAAVLKAAGLTPDGKEDPAEQLKAAAAERDKAAEKLRDKSLRLAVRENADKAGVDPTAVIDSTSFRQSVAELDVDAADYDDQVLAAMKKAVKANPRLAAETKGAGKQGADHSGGGNGSKTDKPKGLAGAITAALGGS